MHIFSLTGSELLDLQEREHRWDMDLEFWARLNSVWAWLHWESTWYTGPNCLNPTGLFALSVVYGPAASAHLGFVRNAELQISSWPGESETSFYQNPSLICMQITLWEEVLFSGIFHFLIHKIHITVANFQGAWEDQVYVKCSPQYQACVSGLMNSEFIFSYQYYWQCCISLDSFIT